MLANLIHTMTSLSTEEPSTSAPLVKGWQRPVKIAFVGASNVGKTELLKQMLRNAGRSTANAESGEGYCAVVIDMKMYDVHSIIIDMPEVDSFEADSYGRSIDGYLLVYDVCHIGETFPAIHGLLANLQSRHNRHSACCVVVGAKYDLLSSDEVFAQSDRFGESLRKQYKVHHVAVSSALNWNVNNALQEVMLLVDANVQEHRLLSRESDDAMKKEQQREHKNCIIS